MYLKGNEFILNLNVPVTIRLPPTPPPSLLSSVSIYTSSPPPPPTPSLSPPPTLPDLVPVRPVITISLTPAPPAVSPPPDIAPVSSKWRCTERRYSSGGGRTSPPSPDPLPLWRCIAADISTYLHWYYSAEFLTAGRPPCGGTCTGSSRSEETPPKTPRKKTRVA